MKTEMTTENKYSNIRANWDEEESILAIYCGSMCIPCLKSETRELRDFLNQLDLEEGKVLKTEPNEPINAVVEDNNRQGQIIQEATYYGLTKREYFAAMVMQGYCAHPDIGNDDTDKIAKYAVMTADALINHLNLDEK